MKKLLALVTLFAAQSTLAHPGHDVASGTMAGLAHPLTGVDHLIALCCVGALLALVSKRVRLAGVAALLAALASGTALGLWGVTVPYAEWMIALSVLVSGFMLVRSGRTQPVLLVGGVALFALFHGYAHGVESSGDALAFVAGFLATSLAIVTLSTLAARAFIERQVLRVAAGAGAGVAGIFLLSALISG